MRLDHHCSQPKSRAQRVLSYFQDNLKTLGTPGEAVEITPPRGL